MWLYSTCLAVTRCLFWLWIFFADLLRVLLAHSHKKTCLMVELSRQTTLRNRDTERRSRLNFYASCRSCSRKQKRHSSEASSGDLSETLRSFNTASHQLHLGFKQVETHHTHGLGLRHACQQFIRPQARDWAEMRNTLKKKSNKEEGLLQ